MKQLSYITQQQAIKLDQELINLYKIPLQNLMEVAGLSVAHCAFDIIKQNQYKNILILCGPGNNGGDGLICARHLQQFGYNPEIILMKKYENQLFIDMIDYCQISGLKIQYLNQIQNLDYLKNFCFIIDAIFGFSYKPPLKIEYLNLFNQLQQMQDKILSIDIPSGWEVDKQSLIIIFKVQDNYNFYPQYLISLTLPKICSIDFKNKHYIGGRFITQHMALQNNWQIPQYQGKELYQQIINQNSNQIVAQL